MHDYQASTRRPRRPRAASAWSLLVRVGVVGALVVTPVLVAGQAQATPAAQASAVTPAWEATYSAPDSFSTRGSDVAVDPASGIVVVVGLAEDYDFSDHILVLAYDAAGAELWSALVAGTLPRYDDTVGGVVIDSARGRVYVSGSVTDALGDRASGVTVAYDLAGRELWRADYDDGEREEYFGPPVVDPVTGLVVVGGKSTSAANVVGDALLLAYTPSGDLTWSRRLGFDPYEDEVIGAPVIAPDGSAIYVQGLSNGTVVIALDARGRTRWLTRVPGDQDLDNGSQLAVSPDGTQLYIGIGDGYSVATLTAIAAADGSLRWTRVLLDRVGSGQPDLGVRTVDLVVDPATGNVFTAVGYSYVLPKYRSSVLANSFEADGSLIWTQTLYDRDQGTLDAFDLAVNPAGPDLIFVGSESEFDGSPYIGFSAYSVQFLDKTTGVNSGGYRRPDDGDIGGSGRAVTIDTATQRAYVTGSDYNETFDRDIFTLCLDLS